MEKSLLAQIEEIRSGEKDLTVDTFQYTPTDQHLKELRGSLFGFIKNHLEEEQNFSKNQDLFQALKDNFYAAKGSNLKALEEAVDQLEGQIKDVDFVAAVLWGSVLYLAKIGQGEVVLIRDGEVKKIDFSKVASGALKDSDSILILNVEDLKKLDLERIAQIFKKESEEIRENLKKELENKNICLLFINLSIDEIKEKPSPIQVEQLGGTPLSTQDSKGIDLVQNPEKSKKPVLDTTKVKEIAVSIFLVLQRLSQKVKTSAQPYAKIAFEKLSEPWRKREPGNLDESKNRQRARIIQIAVVLVVILVVSLVIGAIGKRGAAEKELLAKSIENVKSKFENAQSLKELNPLLASQILTEGKKELDSLPQDDTKVKELSSTFGSLFQEVSRVYKPSIKTVEDLTGAKSGTRAENLSLSSAGLFVSDTGTGSVFRIESSSSDIIVSEKTGLENIAAASDFLYLQTNESIEKSIMKTSQVEKLKSSSGNWKNIVDAQSYKNNLYLLDSKAKQIWKYTPSGSSLTGPSSWLFQELKEEPRAFAIDGSVWVSFKSTLQKYTGGKSQSFEVKNQPESFRDIKDIYTTDSQINLYVLDRGVGGVFVVEKETGNYIGLYKNDKLKNAISLVVDEAKKTLYFLNDNTLYSFNSK